MAVTLRVALTQTRIHFEDKSTNRLVCESIVKRAAQQEADVVVFPEMTLTGFSMHVRRIGEVPELSETLKFFCRLARQYHTYIIFGVVFLQKGRGINAAVVVDNRGIVVAQYQKVHSFSFAKEDRYFKQGAIPVFFRIKNVLCSIVICYDLRFPGLFEAIATRSPSVLFVIANWPSQRISHWDILLQARALDCASMVVGVNRIGFGGGQKYNGHSSVYAPNGVCLMTMGSSQLRTYKMDCQAVDEYRAKFPSLRDKRRLLYARLLR